ncbi:MAG: chromosome segregation protein SMC, partial [Bacteroidota bacterium]
EIVELEKTRAIQASQIENLRRDVERTLNDIAARKEEMKALELRLREQSEAEEAQANRIVAIENAEEKRKADIQQTEKELETIQKKQSDHNRQLDSRRNEFKLNKSMVESLDGFPESIKFLSQDKEWAKRCPLLSDLIYVREEYRVVIENYLENYLSYYVVPDADEAVKAISLLGKSQKGRANFFILDAINHYEMPLLLPGGGVRAVELVETDPQYRHLVEYLLGNVIIVEDDIPALPAGSDITVLSKAGTVVRRRFSMSGGSVGLFEGKKIGR